MSVTSGHREIRMVACMSLDGYIATEGGSSNQEAKGGWTSAEDKREFWREVDDADIIVAGRNTLDNMPPTGKPTVLMSRRPDEPILSMDPDWVVDPYPSEMHDFLAARGGKKFLVCGGAMTYDFFLRWNLVDHLVLVIEPIMLGKGVRLRKPPQTMGGQERCRFSLVKCKPLNARGTLRLDLRRAKEW